MKISPRQQSHFEESRNRFPLMLLLNPTYAQQLELNQLHKLLDLSPGTTIMDFGCGSGRVSLYFLKSGFNVHAIDISSGSLGDLEKIYHKHRKKNWGKLSTSTRLPKQKVDGVVGADILHHVSIQDILPRLLSSLKNGGRLVFSEPNAWHLPWYAYYFIRKIPWDIEKGISQCTYFNLVYQFQKAGFSDIKIDGFGLLPQPIVPNCFQKLNSIFLGSIPALKLFAFRFLISGVV